MLFCFGERWILWVTCHGNLDFVQELFECLIQAKHAERQYWTVVLRLLGEGSAMELL